MGYTMFKSKKENATRRLSKVEIEMLEMIAKEFLNAYQLRATNPSGYMENIACLEGLTEACQHWTDLVRPHWDEKQKLEQSTPYFQFFKDRAIEGALQQENIINAMKEKLAELTQPRIDKFLAEEPRIVSIYTGQTKRRGTWEGQYHMVFSDGTDLSFKNIKDENEIKEKKIVFDQKMKELSLFPQSESAVAESKVFEV